MTTTVSLAQAKAKPPKSKKGKKTGRQPTAKDKPARERSALDTVRLLIIQNPNITTAEAKAQLEATGKKLADGSISTAVYDTRRLLLLIEEVNS